MRSLIVAALTVAAYIGVATTAEASIDPSRVHIVDTYNFTQQRSYFFRGNSPFNKDTNSVEYDVWMQTIANVANATGYTDFPANDKVWLVDVNLENIFDKGFLQEQQFFTENPTKGYFFNWQLLGAPLWPSAFSEAEVQNMIATGDVWKNDQIPARMLAFRSLLQQTPPAGYDAVVYYVHCAAGCDRTGEFVGSYRLAFDVAPNAADTTIAPTFQKNCQECGRCPNYYSAGALGWYCMTLNYFNRTNMAPFSDCFTAFKCELLGSCTATDV